MLTEIPQVVAINTAPDKGVPMVGAHSVKVLQGEGIAGDRYAVGLGAWSRVNPGTVRDISLIETEAIQTANAEFSSYFTFPDTRRNILTKGIRLNELEEGTIFFLGDVVVEAAKDCTPCQRPSKLSGNPNFERAFEDRGGLRVKALSTTLLTEGDPIYVPSDHFQGLVSEFLTVLDTPDVSDRNIEKSFFNYTHGLPTEMKNSMWKLVSARRNSLARKIALSISKA